MPEHALIVDDEPQIRNIVTAYLEDLGIESTHAEGQDDAIGRINGSVHFDLFIIDLRLRQGDGVSLIREIRRREGHSETPVILISGLYSFNNLRELRDSLGNAEVLPKPFRQAAFTEAVNALMGKGQPIGKTGTCQS